MKDTRHITLGVAGHIDHGKTALVRTLTGIETDRLAEEQERGMSIVLGFAHLTLPEGEIDLIDVPGHEKFVRTMISGATGIDAALLVIAANERIKPQTIEHVALMGLLGVRQGCVAVTKSDLTRGDDERAFILAELRGFLSRTFLYDAPIHFTSAVSGEGLEAVNVTLKDLLLRSEITPEHPYFYLPIDRAFTMTGHGTVVTGTLRRGPLHQGQAVELWPQGAKAEVRGLEVHGKSVETAFPGWRTAVNLRGIKKEDLPHGSSLATSGALRPTRLLDTEFSLLSSAERPVKRGQTVAFFHGTGEVSARVYPLAQNEISPGETTPAQLRLTEEIVVPARESFIVRLSSPSRTLGGGVVIDPYPQKHTRMEEDVLRRVRLLVSGSAEEKLSEKLREFGPSGYDLSRLRVDLGLPSTETDWNPPSVRVIHGCFAVHQDVLDGLVVQTEKLIADFHRAQPLRTGMPLEELRRRLPRDLNGSVFPLVLDTLKQSGRIEMPDGLARQSGYSPESALSPVEREIAREIESLFLIGGLKPPRLDDVLKRDRRRKSLYHFLVESGALIPTTERTSNRIVVFHRDAIADAERKLQQHLAFGLGCTVSELNIFLGITRKYSIPLLEYLDEKGITRRVGDLRFIK